MEFVHNFYTPETLDKEFFNSLHREKMYKSDGVFERIWRNPAYDINNDCYVSVGKINNIITNVMFLGKKMWFGWEWDCQELFETYGMIGFFTKHDFRGKGLAKKLFEDFDQKFHIRKLASQGDAQHMIKSVAMEDKYILQ